MLYNFCVGLFVTILFCFFSDALGLMVYIFNLTQFIIKL